MTAVPKPVRTWVPAFLEWIRCYPCVVCVVAGQLRSPTSDPHHLRHRGAGGDDVANVVPLCRHHHREIETIGHTTFERRYGLDLWTLAAKLWATWCALPLDVREPAFG